MTVRNALLALLEQGPMYGYQLRSEFERRTGATWPLNVGQVYTTLARLERDLLVEGHGGRRGGSRHVRRHARPGTTRWRPGSPRRSRRTQPPRDELAIKLALAVTVPGVDVGTVIQQQRTATMTALQDYTRLKRQRRRRPATSPGAWSSTAWSSPPRPRSAGSTTARPGSDVRPSIGPPQRCAEAATEEAIR